MSRQQEPLEVVLNFAVFEDPAEADAAENAFWDGLFALVDESEADDATEPVKDEAKAG